MCVGNEGEVPTEVTATVVGVRGIYRGIISVKESFVSKTEREKRAKIKVIKKGEKDSPPPFLRNMLRLKPTYYVQYGKVLSHLLLAAKWIPRSYPTREPAGR